MSAPSYSPAATCEHDERGCCFRINHDHGDCDGYIFTARDYWRGMKVLEGCEPVGDSLRTLFAHGPYRDHCGGYEVHAWPCFPASVTLSDLRAFVGGEAWARIDPRGGDS